MIHKCHGYFGKVDYLETIEINIWVLWKREEGWAVVIVDFLDDMLFQKDIWAFLLEETTGKPIKLIICFLSMLLKVFCFSLLLQSRRKVYHIPLNQLLTITS